MVRSNYISLSKIDLLTRTNYHFQKLKVSAVLRSKKLYKAVIEDDEISEDRDMDKRTAWEKQNDEAFGIFIVTLLEDKASLFISETKAKAVWNELQRIHAGNIEDQRIDTALELKNIQMGNSELVDAYIMRTRSLATKSATLG